MYYAGDANFNVTALVQGTPSHADLGKVVERYQYDPYGKVTVLNGDADADDPVTEWTVDGGGSDWANEVLYAGYRWDPETGLYHVRHRSYHPTAATWLQRDLTAYPHSLSLYAYVAGRCTSEVDPGGLEARKCIGAASIVTIEYNFPALRLGPVPAGPGTLDFALTVGIRAKGEVCCVECEDGTTGRLYKGSIAGRVQAEVGFTLGVKYHDAFWRVQINALVGIRGYGGLRGQGEGAVEYCTCDDRLEYGYKGYVGGYAGIEGGVMGELIWDSFIGPDESYGIGATAGGRAMVRIANQLSCDASVCRLELGKVDFQARIYTKVRFGRWSTTWGFEWTWDIAGPVWDTAFPSPPALVQKIREAARKAA